MKLTSNNTAYLLAEVVLENGNYQIMRRTPNDDKHLCFLCKELIDDHEIVEIPLFDNNFIVHSHVHCLVKYRMTGKLPD